MRKVIDYVLNYREGGNQCALSIKIDFVSNWVMKEYNEIISEVHKTQRLWDEIVFLMADRKSVSINRAEGYQSRIDEIDAEILSKSGSIEKISESNIFTRRFELLKTILTDNAVKDEKLFDFNFWDRCVDPSDMNDFLTQCVFKDIDKKKLM